MEKVNIITNLDRYVLIKIANEWISLREICNLDTAFCIKKLRPKFHLLIATGEIRISRPLHIKKALAFEWLSLRMVRLSDLALTCSPSYRVKNIQHLKPSFSDRVRTFFHLAKGVSRSEISLMDAFELYLQLGLNGNLHTLSFAGSVDLTNEQFSKLVVYCPRLTSIDLNRCDQVVDDGVLSMVKSCADLQVIVLEGCRRITDQALFHISKHSKLLTTLNVNYCDYVTDSIFDNVSDCGIVTVCRECTELTSLSLVDCSILLDETLLEIARTSNSRLLCLDISSEARAIKTPVYLVLELLSHCTSLVTFNCKNRIGDGALAPDTMELAIAMCEIFHMADIHFDDSADSTLLLNELLRNHSASLQRLSLQYLDSIVIPIHSVCIEECAGQFSDSLTELNYGLRDVQCEVLSDVLAHLPRLHSLRLSGHYRELSNEFAAALCSHCPALTDIGLENCRILSTECVIQMTAQCTALKSLSITQCSGVLPCVNDLCLSRLQHVVISDCRSAFHQRIEKNIVLNPVVFESRSIPHGSIYAVQEISLSKISALRDTDVHALAMMCGRLHTVDVSSCSELTDRAVEHLATELGSRLTKLCVAGIKSLTVKSLRSIAKHCTGLLSLDVSACTSITAVEFKLLCGDPDGVDGCRRLRSLNLMGCFCSDDLIAHLAHNLKHLFDLRVRGCFTRSPNGGQCSYFPTVELSSASKRLVIKGTSILFT